MKRQKQVGETGFTLVELTVTIVIITIVVVSFFGLFVSLVRSTIIAKRQAVAITIATNQMEYLKSLPYDSLIVQSPTTAIQTINGTKYTTKTIIQYVDDAYDGCGTYSTQAQKQLYCRNYPPPSGAPATDLNPADYKIVNVTVTDRNGVRLAAVDTQISARVSETASTTGALFVTVTDPSGSPISGATVNLTNSTVSPIVNKSDDTDANGIVIFYGLPPDSGTDYVINASKTGYSNLTTVNASGSLQPNYPNQKILTQSSSYVTLRLGMQGANSLLVETTDTSGAALGGVKIYAKGGYKTYTATTDYSYYYDNYYSNYNANTVSDSRFVTDAAGLYGVQNLPPINAYLFCNGDNTGASSTNCTIGATTYYLAAAVPYGGTNSLGPINVPQYNPSSPPATTYAYNSTNYLQKVRLLLTTNANFPRVYTMSPYSLSLATGSRSNFQIVINGYNLASASAKLMQGSNTYNGTSCSTTSSQLTCYFDLTSITQGLAQVSVTNSAGTLTLPTTPLGGFNVTP